MITVLPSQISQIDAYAERVLGIPTRALMERAGEGVALAIAERQRRGSVLIFCGGGNNGGDGYALALALHRRGFSPLAVDVFGKGQRSEAGKYFLDAYTALFGAPLSLAEGLKQKAEICVDALFGTGFRGPLPEAAERVISFFKTSGAYTVAIDIPLGVDGESGCLLPEILAVNLTVTLCFVKKGLLSYPAKGAVGELVVCDLGLDKDALKEAFSLGETLEKENLFSLLPERAQNSHKGSFGRVLGLVGSARFPGAALLAAEGALRLGCGLFSLASEMPVLLAALQRTPEILTLPIASIEGITQEEKSALLESARGASALLVGAGSGKSEALRLLLLSLIRTEGCPLVIDADGLNSLAEGREEMEMAFASASRALILTPHPLEMARLAGLTVADVQGARLPLAEKYARKWGVTLVLKGAATVISDGYDTSVSTVGSSALAKGGSGDALAGAIAGLLAQGASPIAAAKAAVYLHGAAGDSLQARLSAYGVLPSDLPKEMALLLAEALSLAKK